MRLAPTCELSTILFVTAVVCGVNDNSKYYEMESSEKKIEYDNPTSAPLPDSESYVIGVKRALLPFRQLSKYLRRPVNDPRSGNALPGIPWKTAQQDTPEIIVKTQTQKRWDRDREADGADKDASCPEIILIRPINMSQLEDRKNHRDVDDIIRSRQQPNNVDVAKEPNRVQKSTSAMPVNNKKVKIDNQIFQGNGINIKLTFSVDVGNQTKELSKALEKNTTSANKKVTNSRSRQ